MDLAKIEATTKWSTPYNVRVMHNFLGMVGYYIRFVEVLYKILNAMTTLLNKGVQFVWIKHCEQAFSTLNQLLTSTPVLKVPNMDQPFVVCTNASKT
jgi:hypothetical protein